jgi:hypothetical protein
MDHLHRWQVLHCPNGLRITKPDWTQQVLTGIGTRTFNEPPLWLLILRICLANINTAHTSGTLKGWAHRALSLTASLEVSTDAFRTRSLCHARSSEYLHNTNGFLGFTGLGVDDQIRKAYRKTFPFTVLFGH